MKKYKHLDRVVLENRTWPDKVIEKQPILCSVDLRDGNQALANPMSIENKLKLFHELVRIGFKEIEVGYPAASQIDYDFIRQLIDENLVPDGVYLQILIPAIEKYIIKSLQAMQGAKNVILHLYNSTSVLQRKVTFKMSKAEIKDLAVFGTTKIKENVDRYLSDSNVVLQYSPESFSDTETDYALEVCEAVMDVWQPTVENKIILNLPETVQWATPNIYADQIEWFCQNMKDRDKAIISVHAHNDRGTGIASAELSVLAGAERVEGTLFGNGERTGNLDIVAFALNMYSDGVDIDLDLSDVPHLKKVYEETTGMDIHKRHPYAGDLVFTAFSGSHQDAIKKGMDMRKDKSPNVPWEVPYLPIDPKDIGRSYEAIIRINSQSGKGGVAYILQQKYDLEIPKKMHPAIGGLVNVESDNLGRELSPEEVYKIVNASFINIEGPIKLVSCDLMTHSRDSETTVCTSVVEYNGETYNIESKGNGPIDAFAKSLKSINIPEFKLVNFFEQAIGSGADSTALSYIQIEDLQDGSKSEWGIGKDSNISLAGIRALLSAYNRLLDAN